MRKLNNPSDGTVSLVYMRPTADQYQQLRQQAGWQQVSAREAETAMAASLCSLLAVHDNKIVACARIVGDGGLYFYIQDMLVDEDYRGQGIGTRMMNELLDWLRDNSGVNAFVGLMAAQDVGGFYRRFGFEERTANRPGMYMPGKLLHEGR